MAGPSRSLAGRRGMALPVVVGGVSAADAGAAQARRRGSPPPGDAWHDAGGHRATRRPVQPDRHASLAGELAAARQGGDHPAGTVARVRYSRGRRSRPRARRVRHAVAARRQPAAARAGRQRNHRTARRPAVASVPAAAEPAAARVRAARGSGRRQAAPRAHPVRHLGAGMRIRAGHGIRLCRSRCRRTSWSTARRCTAIPRLAAPSAIPMSSRSAATCRSATGCGRRSPATRVTPPTATSTPTTTSPG